MTGEQDPAGRIEAAIETRRAQKPIYTIAHGSAAVQAARIIAAVSEDRRKRAEAYYLAAEWHDKQAEDCEQAMSLFAPQSGPWRSASTRSAHHRNSAAGLRLASSYITTP